MIYSYYGADQVAHFCADLYLNSKCHQESFRSIFNQFYSMTKINSHFLTLIVPIS